MVTKLMVFNVLSLANQDSQSIHKNNWIFIILFIYCTLPSLWAAVLLWIACGGSKQRWSGRQNRLALSSLFHFLAWAQVIDVCFCSFGSRDIWPELNSRRWVAFQPAVSGDKENWYSWTDCRFNSRCAWMMMRCLTFLYPLLLHAMAGSVWTKWRRHVLDQN